jgi:putative peptidoglycan lipid II flippase
LKRSSTAAAVGAIGSFLSLIVGAGSDLLLARRLGAHAATDAYFAGIAIPLALGGVLGASVTFTFVPVIAGSRKDGAQMSSRIVWDIAGGVALIGAVIAVLLGVFAHLVTAFVFARLPLPTHVLASAVLVRFATVMPCAALAELLIAVYYLRSAPALPSIVRLFPSGATFTYLLVESSPSVTSLAIVAAVGFIAQVVVLGVGLCWAPEFVFGQRVAHRRDLLRRALVATLPMLAGMLVYRSIPVIERSFLSAFPEGSIAAVAFASRIFQAAGGVFGAGLLAGMLGPVNDLVARAEWRALLDIVERACRILLFVLVPIALLYPATGPGPLSMVFGTRFTPSSLATCHLALCWYLAALPASSIGTVVGQVLYGMSETTRVTLIGVATTTLYVVLILTLRPLIGITAVPFAFAIEVFTGLLVTLRLLNARLRTVGSRGLALGEPLARDAALAALFALLLLFSRSVIGVSAVGTVALAGAALLGYFATSLALPEFFESKWLVKRLTGAM